MSLHWEQELPTRRDLGLWYLAGVAVLLHAGLVAYGVFADESTAVVLLSVAIAVPLVAVVLYMGYTFYAVDVSDDLVWRVAQWTALGIALGTLLTLAVSFGVRLLPGVTIVHGLLVVTITTGGLVGALLGTTTSLRSQDDQLRELTQRNAVLNRVLRHNIKNDVNVITGHAALIESEVDGSAARSVEAIQRTARDITRLSETARALDELFRSPDRESIDLARVTDECVQAADDRYADAEFSTDLAGSAWVEANPIARSVVANLLENAVEHHDGQASVHVTVAPTDEGTVRLAVADDGPGIFDHEREVLQEVREDSFHHGSGMGLWLVKWFTDRYDGDLRFEDNDPRGTVVQVSLPSTDAPTEDATVGR